MDPSVFNTTSLIVESAILNVAEAIQSQSGTTEPRTSSIITGVIQTFVTYISTSYLPVPIPNTTIGSSVSREFGGVLEQGVSETISASTTLEHASPGSRSFSGAQSNSATGSGLNQSFPIRLEAATFTEVKTSTKHGGKPPQSTASPEISDDLSTIGEELQTQVAPTTESLPTPTLSGSIDSEVATERSSTDEIEPTDSKVMSILPEKSTITSTTESKSMSSLPVNPIRTSSTSSSVKSTKSSSLVTSTTQPPQVIETAAPLTDTSSSHAISNGAIVGIILGITAALCIAFYLLRRYRKTIFSSQKAPGGSDATAAEEKRSGGIRGSIMSYISGVNEQGWNASTSTNKTCPHPGPKHGMCVCSRCWADKDRPDSIPVGVPYTIVYHPGLTSLNEVPHNTKNSNREESSNAVSPTPPQPLHHPRPPPVLVSNPRSYSPKRAKDHYYSEHISPHVPRSVPSPAQRPLPHPPHRTRSESGVILGMDEMSPPTAQHGHGTTREDGGDTVSEAPVGGMSRTAVRDEAYIAGPSYDNVFLERKKAYQPIRNARHEPRDDLDAGNGYVAGDEYISDMDDTSDRKGKGVQRRM